MLLKRWVLLLAQCAALASQFLTRIITAMPRKLACLFYRLIKHGQQYVDKGTEYYEAKHREQQIRSLAKRAQKLGLQLVIPKTA